MPQTTTVARLPLTGICKVISDHFSLNESDVLKVAADSLTVENDESGNDVNNLNNVGSRMVGLREAAQLPPGKNLAAMTLNELSDVIAQQNPTEQSENVIPFLLRIAGGEFHYGQRVTPLLPGQKPIKLEKSPSFDKGKEEHKLKVNRAFDVLANEAKFKHLHQIAGWVDLSDKQIWDNYVKDVIQDKIKEGNSVFEAGCGVLAFLMSVQEIVGKNICLGGNDGAKKTIDLVKSELAPEEYRDNFFVGMLPESMDNVPENSWDVVCCNSVFQYIVDKTSAEKAVRGMIRVAKKWVIIADICDDRYEEVTNARKAGLEWTDGLPEYRCYSKSWWIDLFSSANTLVSIRHVETPTYTRRTERYVVYIEKLG